jgi:hypothetical protein
MLVFGERPEGIEAIVDVQGGGDSLAARSDFRDAMSRVPSDHLASAFVDLGAIAESTGVEGQFGEVTTASAALVAEPEGLRLSGSAPLAAEPSSSAGATDGGADEPATLTDWMPSNTLAEVVVFGLRDRLEEAESAIGAAPGGEDVAGALDTLRALAAFGLGLDLDADVLPLLDREVGLAITGLDGTLPSGALLLRPPDATAAADAINRIADRLSAIGGSTTSSDVDGTQITTLSIPDTVDVAFAVADGVVVIGLSNDDVAAAITAHADGSSLATSDAYARTFQVAGTRAGTEAYVDVGALVDLAGGTINLPDDARDILSQLGAFGLTLPSRADQIEFHAVLTIDEPTAQ